MIVPSRGPLMLNIEGTSITDRERVRLLHPLVGGVILFGRNYANPAQLKSLCDEIHALREAPLLIAIDQEGGRVQRCREGFAPIPAMAELGRWWNDAPTDALHAAHALGYLLAAQLRDCGVDVSLAPVLDLDWGQSSVVGDRAFHADPAVVSALAGALVEGFHEAGVGACGKHFPGHGWAADDSHVAIPQDTRTLDEIRVDMRPFGALRLDAVMPAHVIYPAVDHRPAGFSPAWHDLLRCELGFDGVVFSDDLSMAGASVAGDYTDRAEAAWSAGCDILLLCNVGDAADAVLANWRPDRERQTQRDRRVARLFDRKKTNPAGSQRDQALRAAGLTAVATVAERVAARSRELT